MNSSILKLGFLGGSVVSAIGTTHKIAAQMDDRWTLCAGCFCTDDAENQRTANRWGVPESRVYPSYTKLLSAEAGKLDAVVVLTPTPSHAEIVIAALEAGYPVICEKALAISSTESQLIQDVVAKYSGFLAVTYNYTGYSMVRELRSIIRGGRLGKLQQIQIEMPQEGYLRLDGEGKKPSPQSWRLTDYTIPTVSLDLGVHLHHMIHFLSGAQPLELVAINNSYGFFNDIVDNTMCIARYSGNLDCQLWFGKTALGNSNGLRIRVYGEQGSAEWYQMQAETLVVYDNKGRKSTLERSSVELELANDERYNRFKAGHPTGFIEAFANHYWDIADALTEFRQQGQASSPWVFGADIAHQGLVMLETMASSASNHTWKRLPGA
jgi:predicted dehydrogenase